MVFGTLLVVWGTSRLTQSATEGRSESFLAPTLAVDALDDDLRVLYMQSLVIDARCGARYGRDTAERWSPFGRELRRALVACQSARVCGGADDAEPAAELLERADRHVHDGRALDASWDELVEEVRALRA